MTPPEVDGEVGGLLLHLARAAIGEALGEPAGPTVLPEWAERPGACFVTLKLDGELRGCIGSLRAWRPLSEDVRANAVTAALGDPRFSPLESGELPRVRLEVSLLSPLEPVECSDEAALLRRLRPGVDGLMLEHEGHRGTFLPAVWRELPEPAQFVRQLKRKAGLDPDFWAPEVQVSRYTVERWGEPGG